MLNLSKLLGKKSNTKVALSKDEIAELLKVSPEALAAFESSYQTYALSDDAYNAENAIKQHTDSVKYTRKLTDIFNRIENELVAKTPIWIFDGNSVNTNMGTLADTDNPVTLDELLEIPAENRPMLTGNLMKCDLAGNDTSEVLLYQYQMSKSAKTAKEREMYYHMFRQGLDILDLDALTYAMLGTNPNAMGYWLPNIIDAVLTQNFFKIPPTKIIKVPITMLQLTRLEYLTLNRVTLDIVNTYCRRVFNLDLSKDYFIKTGTFSSKFDFRNAHITSPKEVSELGEYLVFIQNQACQMAGALNKVCTYGVSTTNEWVVRDFIKDVENNREIYHGLPLHTEYRVFVDFDSNEVLGISPYWEPNTMRKRFGHAEDSNEPDMVHDYISFKSMEDTMMQRYDRNKNMIVAKINEILPNVALTGQWSIDIMQNGNDFWLIDMALAANSALRECVPAGKLKQPEENWLPKID
jgi:hypothetical protein